MSAGIAVAPAPDDRVMPPVADLRGPFRPVQYLGNKLRVLDQITEAVGSLAPNGSRVVDLFSGTSVVSQALASSGFAVTAVDTQEYARVFASALLGVGRAGAYSKAELVLRLARRCLSDPSFEAWKPFADRECTLLRSGQIRELAELYQELPLAWRNANSPLYRYTRVGDDEAAFDRYPLVTCMYAGTYFGIAQSLMIDALRMSIHRLRMRCELTTWQSSAALTALLSAASSAVHSAGKHFAQPLTAGSGHNVQFRSKRLTTDRSICVETAFAAASAAIDRRAPVDGDAHRALKISAEAAAQSCPSSVFYLDPPYTAQQYSRFYHVLETITDYTLHSVVHKGVVTSGLYPVRRFKSAFSSKVGAPRSFAHILDAALENRCSAVISYSQSERNSTGNARMISLESLTAMCIERYGKSSVYVSEMVHRYRQFNAGHLSNTERNDPEILIVCKAK